MPETALRVSDPGAGVSVLEERYEQESDFSPELDRPAERAVEAEPVSKPDRQRRSDGTFLPAAAERPAAQQHSRAVSRLALDLGFSQEEIDQTAPEILEDRVYHVNRRTFEMLAAQKAAVGNGLHAAEGGAQPVEPKEPEAEFDYSMLDETFAKHLKAKDARLAQLEAKLASQEQARVTEGRDEQIDKIFAELADPERFGEGGRKELPYDSDEMERRRVLVGKANTLPSGTLKERISKAHRILYGAPARRSAGEETSDYDTPARSAPSELERRREAWDAGRLAVPSHRKPAPLSAEARATLAAKRYLEQFPIEGTSSLDPNDEP